MLKRHTSGPQHKAASERILTGNGMATSAHLRHCYARTLRGSSPSFIARERRFRGRRAVFGNGAELKLAPKPNQSSCCAPCGSASP
jgi:hypothetical protein